MNTHFDHETHSKASKVFMSKRDRRNWKYKIVSEETLIIVFVMENQERYILE